MGEHWHIYVEWNKVCAIQLVKWASGPHSSHPVHLASRVPYSSYVKHDWKSAGPHISKGKYHEISRRARKMIINCHFLRSRNGIWRPHLRGIDLKTKASNWRYQNCISAKEEIGSYLCVYCFRLCLSIVCVEMCKYTGHKSERNMWVIRCKLLFVVALLPSKHAQNPQCIAAKKTSHWIVREQICL